VIDDHLFAIFGWNEEFRYHCEEADWINLKQKDGKFEEINIVNLTNNQEDIMLDSVMIFEPSIEE
jgi:hypothetical protein